MTTINDLLSAMDRISPLAHAEPWDNVGLILGSPSAPLTGPVLLAIDLSDAVVAEAEQAGACAIVAYHPPIFKPTKRLVSTDGTLAPVLRAASANIALCSPHTALDAAPAGMTDWLADGLLDRQGIIGADRRSLHHATDQPESQQCKLVTFVPHDHLDSVMQALATAGAGRIGNYELCSFAIPGQGTFVGNESSNPTLGSAGNLERVNEHRLEMVVSRKALPLAIETLKRFHPYEEPPLDIYELLGRPLRCIGAGRRLVLDQPASLDKLAQRLRDHLGVRAVKIAAATDQPVSVLGICPGAGFSLAAPARDDGCQVFVTGEMTHHEVRSLVLSGMSVLLAGHTDTERGFLPTYAQKLVDALKDIGWPGTPKDVRVAESDTSLFRLAT